MGMKIAMSSEKGKGVKVSAENLLCTPDAIPHFCLPNLPVRLHAKGKCMVCGFQKSIFWKGGVDQTLQCFKRDKDTEQILKP